FPRHLDRPGHRVVRGGAERAIRGGRRRLHHHSRHLPPDPPPDLIFPFASAAKSARSRAFSTFPMALRGSSSRKRTRLGTLKLASRPLRGPITAAASRSAAPPFGTPAATTASPKSGSGMPTTADSATPSNLSIHSSTSRG